MSGSMHTDRLGSAAETVRETPLSELAPVLEPLRQSVDSFRRAHEGFVPPEIFPIVLGIAGQYLCLEYVLRVLDGQGDPVGYLLKQRGSHEHGWTGQFHIPGVTFTVTTGTDMMAAARERLEREIDLFTPERWNRERQRLRAVGLEAHDEPERNTTCLTLVKLLDLRPDEVTIGTGWRLVGISEFPSDPTVVDHHRETLAWVSREGREGFELVDLRRRGETS
jgi:hypothetical protein